MRARLRYRSLLDLYRKSKAGVPRAHSGYAVEAEGCTMMWKDGTASEMPSFGLGKKSKFKAHVLHHRIPVQQLESLERFSSFPTTLYASLLEKRQYSHTDSCSLIFLSMLSSIVMGEYGNPPSPKLYLRRFQHRGVTLSYWRKYGKRRWSRSFR
jgi:hypothetical protein